MGADDEAPERLAEEIRKAKAVSALSQAEIGRRVAEALGREAPIHQTVVGSWLRGESVPSIEQVLALDTVFDFGDGELLMRAGLISRPTALTAIGRDPLLDTCGREVLRRFYISMVDAVSRERAEGGQFDDVLNKNLLKRYLAYLRRRLNGWLSGGEQPPGPIGSEELAGQYTVPTPTRAEPEPVPTDELVAKQLRKALKRRAVDAAVAAVDAQLGEIDQQLAGLAQAHPGLSAEDILNLVDSEEP